MKTHVYDFISKDFFTSVKARTLREAVDKFCYMFGESAFDSVREIKNNPVFLIEDQVNVFDKDK